MRKKESKPFSQLSKSQKRIEVVRDILIQIRRKVFKVIKGQYFDFDVTTEALVNVTEDLDTCQLNDLVGQKKVKCTGCAKAGLFLGYIDKTNHLNLRQAKEYTFENEAIIRRLKPLFSKNQLDLIECAFERSIVDEADNTYLSVWDSDKYKYRRTEIAEKAIKFGKKYQSNEERLKAICKNMIKNNGIFIP